ncbi:MAG: DNA polymerase I [Lachnospiraceae bacterium]|nr:DNA polymerase I [Lachnospiraceae bacterium]
MKLLLVDGYSILNRGFYGLPLLSNKDGIYTNAVLGFLNILFKVTEDEKPDYLTVAFDVHAPTFRHKMYEGYKGTRKPMPEELKMQLPIIREVLSSMQVNIVEMEGYEADDLLGTLARQAESAGLDVTLLSGDRDLLQIASEKIKISIPKTTGGKTETFNYYASDVAREYGVTPLEFIEVKALQGDSSDNIPGVSKVGPKTATELIATYHSLENLYDHIDEITKKALHENLVNDKEMAFFSRTLSRIEVNAPIELNLDASKFEKMLNDASMDVLLKYNLKSVITKLENIGGSDASAVKENRMEEFNFEVIEDFNKTEDIISKLAKAGEVGMAATDTGVALSLAGDTYFVRFYGFVNKEYMQNAVVNALKSDTRVTTLGVKDIYDYIGDYRTGFEDCEILAYLIDPLKGEYPVTYLSERYLNKFFGDEKELIKDAEKYAAVKASISAELFKALEAEVDKLNMLKLYRDVEMPLSYVLYSMEREGVLVDRKALKEYSDKCLEGIARLEKKIYEEAGTEFNINSPKQLGEVLFEKLQLPGGKKTKSGYSTAADVLEKLSVDYPIVNDILEYRTLSKLNSTYAEGLQNYISEDGRIHAHFNQTITATGRLSSTDPNLQNIPIRTELGRELRKVFYPKDGFTFVDADYSQIELRLMAHMSGDEKMIQAFKEGKDIHRSTASHVFNTPFDEVTAEQRRSAKAVNFGIIYGISDFGLSRDIGIDMKSAKKYKEDYFGNFPKIKKYLDDTVKKAKEDGFTTTLFGRIRPIPELKSSNFMQRSFGERVAMNAPLQGTAADIMKIAMINIFNRMKAENLESKMLIQVHDEVLIETKLSEKDTVMKLVSEEMEKAASLSVDLLAEAHDGATWYDAK